MKHLYFNSIFNSTFFIYLLCDAICYKWQKFKVRGFVFISSHPFGFVFNGIYFN